MPKPSSSWLVALQGQDPLAVHDLIMHGADPDVPAQGLGNPPMLPLAWVVGQCTAQHLFEENFAVLDELLARGTRIIPRLPDPSCPPPVHAHPLAYAIAQAHPSASRFLLGQLPPAQHQALAFPVRLDPEDDAGPDSPPRAATLLDLALSHGRFQDAAHLWNQAQHVQGLAPHPSRACPISGLPQSSTLAMAMGALGPNGQDNPTAQGLVQHLLDMDWPAHDLAHALRVGIQSHAPLPIIHHLLDKGAPTATPPGQLPLLAARPAMDPLPGVITALVRAGADPDAPVDCDFGATGLDVRPCAPRHLSPRPPAMHQGLPVLALAARLGQGPAVAELIQAGANPNLATTRDGETPLHMACMGAGRPERTRAQIVAQLLGAGADPGALDASGRTPLELWIMDATPTPALPAQVLDTARALATATLATRPECLATLSSGLHPGTVLGVPVDNELIQAWTQVFQAHQHQRDLEASLPQARPATPAPRL